MAIINVLALAALLVALPILALGWIGTARAAHLIARASILTGDQTSTAARSDSVGAAASGELETGRAELRRDPAGALLDPTIARELQRRNAARSRAKSGRKPH